MSGLRHPVGEQDERVYWARRITLIALLVVLTAVVVIVVRTVGGGSGGHAEAPVVSTPSGSASPSSSPSSSPSVSTSPSGSSTSTGSSSASSSAPGTAVLLPRVTPTGPLSSTASGTASGTATESGTPSSGSTHAALPATCTNAQLQVDLMPVTRKLSAGASLTSQVTVHSTTAGCLARIDPWSLSVTVMSGSDRVWTTAQCTGTVPRRTVWVSRTVGDHFPVVWNGHRSSPECPSLPVEVARPGTYTIFAKLGDSTSPHRVLTIS